MRCRWQELQKLCALIQRRRPHPEDQVRSSLVESGRVICPPKRLLRDCVCVDTTLSSFTMHLNLLENAWLLVTSAMPCPATSSRMCCLTDRELLMHCGLSGCRHCIPSETAFTGQDSGTGLGGLPEETWRRCTLTDMRSSHPFLTTTIFPGEVELYRTRGHTSVCNFRLCRSIVLVQLVVRPTAAWLQF